MKKVFVGLSGGVDSAVSAALLKEQGFDVTGVFIKIWSPEFLECTWREDRLEAMRVAAHLGIPFLEIDLSKEYKDLVVSDMIDQYKKGRTPNPDVLCNKTIKFGAFAEWAFENGADTIATGHYARIINEEGTARLLKGVDPGKDQSYFLYRITKEVLAKTIFPVGQFTKKEIRQKADAFALPNADRPDSQGLCFVGEVSIEEFLSRFMPLSRGALLDISGRTLGSHNGAALYTIGQRHGFHLSAEIPSGPYYVTKIDTEKNIVFVTRERSAIEHKIATLEDLHWINADAACVDAVPRYHAKPVPAQIKNNTATFDMPLQLTPGQSLVFYKDEECLGGALIHSVEH
jgi:tRNA-specific 2-thiouridylase